MQVMKPFPTTDPRAHALRDRFHAACAADELPVPVEAMARALEGKPKVLAGELSMPEPAVREESRVASAAELASWFGVSEETMGWRLYNLGVVSERPE